MAMVINSNVMSLNAQRNLGKSGNSLATSMQRLSSGLRINSAKDDAAGLAISNRMTSQIRGLNQAMRNANDGISLAQTAEGALQESTNILQRMRELSIQSANATNSATDRASLQSEVNQLISEMDRIASTTTFNSQKLLNGTFSNQAFQVGSNANETIRVSVASAKTSDLGQINSVAFAGFNLADVSASAASPASGVLAQTLTFTVDGTAETVSVTAGDSASAIADNVNANVSSISADARTGARITVGSDTANDRYDITINGTTVSAIDTAGTAAGMGAAVAAAIQGSSALSNLTVTDNGDGTVDIVDETGADILFDDVTETVTAGALSFTVSEMSYAGAFSAATTVATTEGASVTGDIQFTSTLDSTSTMSLYSSNGVGLVTTATSTGAGGGTVTAETARIVDVDISTVSGSNTALGLIDAALAMIDSQRANLGAIQNRMESTISNLANISENVSAARSRILDADFAAETANLTRSQILQQAGVAMLAQANASPQNVLSLLQ
ncbi:Flagellin protein FlaB [hydrothermal vent metagenome]|uniref:Flagellin protein FlaB n=1 Tax=hydrothermal vent metagenome TaxID=652676 RepID=A0A3B1B468_9ZZZZ